VGGKTTKQKGAFEREVLSVMQRLPEYTSEEEER